ncbi:MAG: carboxypeptidase-like regulatory domain-containing protein [Acidobacteriota bacterium]
MRLLLTSLLFASLASAQNTGRIEGRVVSVTGEPVRKATVRINGTSTERGQQPPVYVEITGSDGSFIAENVAAGRYVAQAQRSGFTTAQQPNGSVNIAQFTLAAGETHRGVEIKMAPLVAINGTVTDIDGEPVSNVQIRLMRWTFQQGRIRLQNTSGANSDDRGQFRLTNVNAGHYYVVADDMSGRAVNQGGNEIRGRSAQDQNLATYYPSSGDTKGAVAVDVGTTEVTNVAIRMRRGRMFSVKGTIVDGTTGAPVQGQVQVFDRADPSTNPNFNFSGGGTPGAFDLRLPPGDYTLMVRSNLPPPPPPPPPPGISPTPSVPVQVNQAPRIITGRLDVSVGNADITGLTMRLTPGAEITGRITIEGGMDLATFFQTSGIQQANRTGAIAINGAAGGIGPVIGGFTTAAPAGPQQFSRIVLNAAEGQPNGVTGNAGADGTFRITGVAPSKYTIALAPLPPAAYIKSIRWGGQEIINSLLDLSSGSGGTLDIMLSPKPATLNGTVRDSQGQAAPPRTMVVVWPRTPRASDGNGGVVVIPTRDDQGGFTLAGMVPGEYYIAAFMNAPQDFIRAPEFLTRFTQNATSLSLREGETATAEPKLISKEAVEKVTAQFP